MTYTPEVTDVEPLLPLTFPHYEVHTVEQPALSDVKERREPDLPFHLPVLTREMLERRTQTRLENEARMMQHCCDRIDHALDESMLSWR